MIDSVVRQSRHQFSGSKEVYSPRFAKNFEKTFINLYECVEEDKVFINEINKLVVINSSHSVYPQTISFPCSFSLKFSKSLTYGKLIIYTQLILFSHYLT